LKHCEQHNQKKKTTITNADSMYKNKNNTF